MNSDPHFHAKVLRRYEPELLILWKVSTALFRRWAYLFFIGMWKGERSITEAHELTICGIVIARKYLLIASGRSFNGPLRVYYRIKVYPPNSACNLPGSRDNRDDE